MPGRAEHHQLVFHPGQDFDVRVLAFALDQTQIKFVEGDLLDDIRRVLHMQAYPALGVALHEGADQQGGEVVAHGQGGADVQRAETGLAVEQVFDRAGLVQQGHGLGQQLPGQGVETQPLAGAVEQLAAGLALQLGQRSAGRRLRQGQLFGGAGHAFLLGHGNENLELTESKSHIYITDNLYLDNSVNRYCGCHYNDAQLRPLALANSKLSEPP
ncbi:hypothetical protein D9M68_642990 [compost metagenome]